jgi:hypothetical protein
VLVELDNGCTFGFPPRLAQGLETAAAEQLSQVEILGAGPDGGGVRDPELHGAPGWPRGFACQVRRRSRQWGEGREAEDGGWVMCAN